MKSDEKTIRLGVFNEDGTTSRHCYPNIWDIEQTIGQPRIVAAPSANHVELMIEFSRLLREPFGLLFVLLVSQRGHVPGRYQSPRPTSRTETEAFLRAHADFFEHDGRSHIWLTSLPDNATIIYNNHDVLYVYGGPIPSYLEVLEKQGLTRGVIGFPVPHIHCYNEEQDDAEEAVLQTWDWMHFPLEAHDNP